ncbi:MULTISPECIES: gallidermin/nisin family lantibiotic [Nocardia]|uniref:Gallidermin/nisin family lantibiotic n=1 Tax=Nocardia jiangxiensis TaxID=282685 RepID=A0ABW6RR00_9NOCA|nr:MULTISPECIES: gallidermin/nisin family lantibiotic [Nocardia]MBY8854989.1 gallidermin/nisin family lantibiotic [Nocardia coffeae]
MSDFDLDFQVRSIGLDGPAKQVTSVSLCTPGCVTGAMQTCPVQTATCGCPISK